MDPYLEHPELWPDVHNRLLAALADELGDKLRPSYYARLEERTYVVEPDGLLLVGRPDLSVLGSEAPAHLAQTQATGVLTVEVPVPDRIRETFLEVRAAGSGEVVTALELLSPTNKGRSLYEHKLGTRTNLVEVDLIRTGEPMPVRGAPPHDHPRQSRHHPAPRRVAAVRAAGCHPRVHYALAGRSHGTSSRPGLNLATTL